MDYVTLGLMKAEFEDACAAIDARADEAETESMHYAWQSLLRGDTNGRDRGVDRVRKAQESRKGAKLEAWLRIGEKYGLDRDQAEATLKKSQSLQ